MKKWVVQLSLAAIAAFSLQFRAQAEFFSGFIYSVHEGGEREKVEAINFTLDAQGHLRSGIGLGGAVTAGGVITFTSPHPVYPFASGILSNGVITATAAYSRPERGQHAVLLEAAATSPVLSEADGLYGRVQRIHPHRGIRDMNRVRYAEGEFFAVGPIGAFARSDNGLDWFRAGLPTHSALLDVAKAGGRYVVAAEEGVIFTSTNPVEWSSVSISTNAIAAVTHGNGVFLAVDQLGFIFRSADGENWTAQGAPIPQQTNSYSPVPLAISFHPGPKLDFLNDRFVIWATNRVAMSHDGVVWSAPTGIGISPARGVHQTPMAHGNDRYVLVNGMHSAVSLDGTSWTVQMHQRPIFSQPSPYLLTFAEGKFWSVSHDAFRSSTDGTNWVILRQNAPYAARSIVHAEGAFLAVGDNSYLSKDGVQWEVPEQNFLAPLPHEGFSMITGTNPITGTGSTVNKGFYSMNPMEGPVDEADVNGHLQLGPLRIWVGDKGYIYYAHQGEPSRFGALSPVTTNDLLAAAGSQADKVGLIVGRNGTVLRVANDQTGALVRLLPRVTTNDLVSAAWHPPFQNFPGGVVIVGENGSIYFSPAPDFTTLIPARSPTTSFLWAVLTPNFFETPATGTFIAAGDNGTILFSSNAVDWNLAETESTNDFIGLSLFGPRGLQGFFAHQADGTISHSPDGRAWTNVPISAVDSLPHNGDTREPGHIQGLALGDGLLVAVGHGFTGASADLRHWQYTRKNAAYEDVAYGNGVWVAVGWNGRIDSSHNGVSWTNRRAPMGQLVEPGAPRRPEILPSPTSPREAQLRAVTYGGGRFVAVGEWGVILVSEDGLIWVDKSLNAAVALKDVEYANGLFVALGGGRSVVSADGGVTWNAHAGPASATQLSWGNGRFVANGSSSVAISVSGSEWETHILPVVPDLGSLLELSEIVFSEGTFYGLSRRKRLYTSTTGTNWTQVFTGINRHQSGDIAGSAMVAANGQLFIAAAREIFTIALEDTGSPLFLKQPTDKTAEPGATVALEAEIADSPGARFQWFRNGVPIPGATSPTLTIDNGQRFSGGEYVLAASNDAGSRRSAPARVRIVAPPMQTLDNWARYHEVDGRLGADDDLDGMSAAAEYLLGSDPHVPGEEAKPTFLLLNQNNQTVPAIQFTRRKEASGASVRVRIKRALNGNVETSVTHQVEDLGNGLERVTAMPDIPLDGFEKLFFTIEGSVSTP